MSHTEWKYKPVLESAVTNIKSDTPLSKFKVNDIG